MPQILIKPRKNDFFRVNLGVVGDLKHISTIRKTVVFRIVKVKLTLKRLFFRLWRTNRTIFLIIKYALLNYDRKFIVIVHKKSVRPSRTKAVILLYDIIISVKYTFPVISADRLLTLSVPLKCVIPDQ